MTQTDYINFNVQKAQIWHNHHVLSTFFCLANVWTFRLIDSHSDSSFNHQQQNHKEKSPYLSCTKYNNIYYINSYCVISHYIFCNITLHHTSTFVISYHTIYFHIPWYFHIICNVTSLQYTTSYHIKWEISHMI